MVTGDLSRDVRLEALGAGATDFLTKPVDIVEFSSRVKNMLMLRSYERHVTHHAAHLAAEVRKATQAIANREHEVIVRLARAAEYIDPTTGAHIQRIAHLARCIAVGLDLPEDEREALFDAAPMHDIGKVAVPSAILMKPGPLTAEEFEVVKKHPSVGYDILRDSESRLIRTAAVIALTHHERWDGTGYPQRIKGEDIPLFGRIAAVADVFDALTSLRPYKAAWPIQRAIDEIKRCSGSQFDPSVVRSFLAQIPNLVDIKNRYATSA
jgi:putative two-component system response regulator